MRSYVVKRLLQLIPILIGITLLAYLMMYLAGGNAVEAMLENQGVAVSQEVIDARKHELGLDQPFIVQYLNWLGGVLTGDMGVSYISGKDVFQTFVSKLPATIVLTVLSVLLTIAISVPLGILAAVKRNRAVDYAIRALGFIGNSLPNFFVALLLIYVRRRLLDIGMTINKIDQMVYSESYGKALGAEDAEKSMNNLVKSYLYGETDDNDVPLLYRGLDM